MRLVQFWLLVKLSLKQISADLIGFIEMNTILLLIAEYVHRAFGPNGIRHIIEQPGSPIKRLLTPTDGNLFVFKTAQAKHAMHERYAQQTKLLLLLWSLIF